MGKEIRGRMQWRMRGGDGDEGRRLLGGGVCGEGMRSGDCGERDTGRMG